MFLYIKVC